MIRSRFGLLALCAVVFGLMAVSTTSAQAETGAQWLLAEKAPNSGKIAFLKAKVELEAESTGILHSKISGFTVLFECTTLSTVNANLLANGSVGKELNVEGKPVGAKIKFSGCITKLNGETSPACQPTAGGTEVGVINTNEGHGLIVLHTFQIDNPGTKEEVVLKQELVQISPDTGETFATIEMSKLCAVGTKVPVIGKAYLKDCEKQLEGACIDRFLTSQAKHLTEVGPLTELWVISKTEEHKASILGSGWAFLGGEHLGIKVSGDPA